MLIIMVQLFQNQKLHKNQFVHSLFSLKITLKFYTKLIYITELKYLAKFPIEDNKNTIVAIIHIGPYKSGFVSIFRKNFFLCY